MAALRVQKTRVYEYGYTVTVKGETSRQVLGTVNGNSSEFERKRAEIDYANRLATKDQRDVSVWFIEPIGE